MFLFVSRCVCVTETETENQEIKRQRGEEKSLLLSCFIYLFCSKLSYSSSHCQCVLRGRLCDITWVGGPLKGALSRRGVFLLGDPSQSFSDETESARSSPESSPPVVGRKCFLKCSYNTLSQ